MTEPTIKYKAVGRSCDVRMVTNFLTNNGGKFQKQDIQDPFFDEIRFGEEEYQNLLKQDWFLKTDIEVYKV